MSDPTTERIELELQTAVALRNWLITVSQRLGLDTETAAETPTPPTTTPPAAIAPLFGELALRLDAICTAATDTVTVRVHGVPDPVDVAESAATASDPPGPQPYNDEREYAVHLPVHIWAATPTRSTTSPSEGDHRE